MTEWPSKGRGQRAEEGRGQRAEGRGERGEGCRVTRRLTGREAERLKAAEEGS